MTTINMKHKKPIRDLFLIPTYFYKYPYFKLIEQSASK